MPAIINEVLICKEFGWTYQEFLSQPRDFIDAIKAESMVRARIQHNEQ